MRWLWLSLGLVLLVVGPASAQQAVCGWAAQPCVTRGSTGTGGTSAKSIQGTSTQVLAANANRKHLAIDNESATATIACSFGGTAAINTAGSWTIAPLLTRTWNAYVPGEAVNCISSAGPSAATVEEN